MSNSAPKRSELLAVRQVADELGVHEITVRRAVRSGELAAVTLGQTGHYRISREAVDDYLLPVEPEAKP